MVKRIYVEKRKEYDESAKEILKDLRENLGLENLEKVKIVNRYDVENISEETLKKAKNTVFSEPQVDICYEDTYEIKPEEKVFGVEFLPGQFDQRANSLS